MFFKSLLKKVMKSKEAKNAGWLIAGRIVQLLLSFFISIITARYLGPSNFGIINYSAAYVAFFTAFCTLGINSVIIKDFADSPDEEGIAIGTTIILRVMSSLLSAIMIIAFVYIIDHDEPITITVTILCSLSLIFQVFDTFNYWFQHHYKSKVTSIAILVAYIITSLYKVILLVLRKNVCWFAFATSVDYICLAICLIVAYKKNDGPKLSFSFIKAKALLSKSYNYILSGMMVAIYGQTDKLMLKQMLNETSVGYYSLASTLNNMWIFVLAAIIDSMVPTIIRYGNTNKEMFEKKNRQLYAIVIYCSLIVAIGFTVLGEWVIKLLYGEDYLGAVAPLSIVCWYTMFSYLGVARNAWVVTTNNQKYLKYIGAIAAVANVILNLCFIPRWGAAGAAMASLITQILTITLVPYLIKDMRPNVKLMLEAFLLRKI